MLPATVRLARYAARGGRARDIVATLDTLVDDAAKARGWRVAKVQAASDGRRHPAGRPQPRRSPC